MTAHPADLPSRNTGHQGVGFDVAVDDGTSGNEGVFANGNAADDSTVSTESSALANQGFRYSSLRVTAERGL